MKFGATLEKEIYGVIVCLQRPVYEYHDRLIIFNLTRDKYIPFTLSREEGVWGLFALRNAIKHARRCFGGKK